MGQTLQDKRANILRALRSSDTQIRRSAVQELASSQIPDRFVILEKLDAIEKNPGVKATISQALVEADDFDDSSKKKVVASLTEEQKKILKALGSDNCEQVKKAFTFLLKKKRREFLRTMLQVEKKWKDPFFKLCNLRLLMGMGERSVSLVAGYLLERDSEVVQAALQVLSRIGNEDAFEKIIDALPSMIPVSQRKALHVLKHANITFLKPVLRNLVNSSMYQQRKIAARIIGTLDKVDYLEFLEILIGDEEKDVLEVAWNALESLADKGIKEAQNLIRGVGEQTGHQRVLREKRRAFHQKGEVLDFITLKQQLGQCKDAKEISSIIQKIGFSNGDNQHKTNLLLSFLKHEDSRIRADSVEALSCCDLSAAEYEKVAELLNDENNRVLGNVVLLLHESEEFETRWYGKSFRVLERLAGSANANFNLTALFCVDHIMDERFLQLVIPLMKEKESLVKDKATQLLEGWAIVSENVKRELEIFKNREVAMLDKDADLDEFID